MNVRLYQEFHNPKMFKILKRGVASNVTAAMVALSDRSGEAELRVPRMRKGGFSNQGGSLSATKIETNYRTVAVEARRLDAMDSFVADAKDRGDILLNWEAGQTSGPEKRTAKLISKGVEICVGTPFELRMQVAAIRQALKSSWQTATQPERVFVPVFVGRVSGPASVFVF